MAAPSRVLKVQRIAQAVLRRASIATGLADRSSRKYFIGALAVMHNEAAIIREWMSTHVREGIQHFYLIDHKSTDDWRSCIADYIELGLVTVIPAVGANLDDVRAKYAAPAIAGCEWLLVLDLDEFTHCTTDRTISAYLQAMPNSVAQIKVPWLIFGTSGNLAQPRSVVRACRSREDIRVAYDRRWHVKSIVRTRRLINIRAHGHLVVGKSVAPLEGFPEVDAGPYLPDSLRAKEPDFWIVQNHYNLQSRQQFEEKARKSGYTAAGKTKYTEAYFQRTEAYSNSVCDDRLYMRHRDLYDCLEEIGDQCH